MSKYIKGYRSNVSPEFAQFCNDHRGMTIHALLNEITPEYINEHGQQRFHVRISSDRDKFISELNKVLRILRKNGCQVMIETCANGLNGVTVTLEKYLINRPAHGIINWGNDYEALKELCKRWTVWTYDNELHGYEIGNFPYITNTWEVDDGGC